MEEVYRYEEEKVRKFSWQNQAQRLIKTVKELMGC
jgi:hypothetical protein